MDKRDRAWRRKQTKKIQQKRIQKWKNAHWEVTKKNYVGMMKKHHFGCGCRICKGWKHGHEHKYKHSERKQLVDND